MTQRQDKKAADKKYYEQNKERIKQKAKQRYYANRDRELERLRQRKPDQKALHAKRKAKYPEYSKVSKANQDARSWKAPGKITSSQVRELFKSQKGKCFYCKVDLTPKYSLDHMVPFCKGGSNYIDNIAICCRRCNFQKHTMNWDEFLLVVVKRG